MSLDFNELLLSFIPLFVAIVIRVMGRAGSRAFAKVASLFMAGIAVMMIRVGLSGMVGK
jgi:small neutral amino acid transporter SnatA (MarC family)